MVSARRNLTAGLERLLLQLRQEGIRDERVLQALAAVPRHQFVDEALALRAYENSALPIGDGQTISQPYIVARMTELLLGGLPLKRVLEIGTGSGYQTAVLAQLATEVFTVERIAGLQYHAKRRLRALDLHNISYRTGDGWQGWSSKAPFDAIIVTAAPDEVPQALLEQLADGGVLVIPVGAQQQQLQRWCREGDSWQQQSLEPVRFVPLVKDDR